MTPSQSLARNSFIFGEPPGFFAPMAPLLNQSSELQSVFSAFEQNLGSALTVGSIPFQLMNASILEIRFNQLMAAERIRSRKSEFDGMSDDERHLTADTIANERMRTELADPDTINRHAKSTLAGLGNHLRDPRFMFSSEELLRQVLVMSWGAFETFVNDAVKSILNLKPELISDVIQARPYRDVVTTKTLLGALESADYNLSSRMGDFLAGLVPLDSVDKIQSASQVVFRSSPLDAHLKSPLLWRIAQQRHVIVHRRSVVDMRYRERTGDTTPVGQRLILKASDIEEGLVFLRDVGCLLYQSALERLAGTNPAGKI